jgi:alpha-1,2-mannosyltransferase
MMANSFRIFLAVLSLLYAGTMVRDVAAQLSSADGLLLANGTSPLGGDYINTFAAGTLAAAGRVLEVYDPAAFMAFERTLIPADIGLRLWAYPPISLPLVAPFGLLPYLAGLGSWSLLGLLLLAIGGRRVGLSWLDTGLLVLSPAAMTCVYFGQTGNLAIGLLLIALAARKPVDGGSALAATLLTIKPQLGVLLPVFWAIQRRFVLIGVTTGLVAAFVVISLALLGPQPWVDYASKTLPVLSELERTGSGAFTAMIPSVFMAMRILTGDPQLAQWVHFAVALIVVVLCVWRMLRTGDRLRQSAILLTAGALVTPYIHIYDLAGTVAAGLLCLNAAAARSGVGQIAAGLAVVAAWALPMDTLAGNDAGAPVGPIVLLGLFAVVAWPSPRTAER